MKKFMTEPTSNQPPVAERSRYEYSSPIEAAKGVFNKETSSNCLLAGVQKVLYAVAAVFVAVGTLFMNALRAIGNGGLAVRDFFAGKTVTAENSVAGTTGDEMLPHVSTFMESAKSFVGQTADVLYNLSLRKVVEGTKAHTIYTWDKFQAWRNAPTAEGTASKPGLFSQVRSTTISILEAVSTG